ncbi:MAG TPA: hypothetical protein P5092_04545 [Ruminococcus sp.]|nr:hypothetical protein [Ruminococcus sp.]
MCKYNENEELIKTPAAKRSVILFLLGIPMIYVASLGKENIFCLIISIAYVILLFVNGIISFPIIIKNIYKKNKNK